ncbi:hypothetical protein PVAP13_9KG464500 [Panicum virgatum]|uniref:Trichome birefringence-like N-terminal domain-containing protein n=2 Tax=Panicum virgatum TaxID=38727 RepID=A0A8T0NWT8_PANVG|nr:hypothetical protein PVAP13_9KG464500 [Panicum virgatum]
MIHGSLFFFEGNPRLTSATRHCPLPCNCHLLIGSSNSIASRPHRPNSQQPAGRGSMERQRSPASCSSSYHCHLLSPKSLLSVSLASLSLLFYFLLAPRHGRPLHLHLAFAAAPAPVLVAGGGYWGDPAAAEVEEAVVGLGRRDLIAEGASPAVAGGLSVRGVGSAAEAQETAAGGGNGGTPSNGEDLRGQVAEARNHTLRGLDSGGEVKEAAPQPQGSGGERLAKPKDLISERPNLEEGKNLSKETLGSSAAPALKLEGKGSPRDVNFSIQASGPAKGTRDEFLQDDHVDDGRNSSVHLAYASQQGRRRESSDNSTLGYNPGAAPVNPDKQETAKSNMDFARSDAAQCDVSDGSWVFDESYPLYESNSCPFIDEGFSCQANGRMDKSYMKMRWQPKHCNVPRFDARKMLEMLRGKRLVFVGDSINRNQWESMMCLLSTAISDPSRIRETRGRKITKDKGHYNFKFLYRCCRTIIAVWSIIRHISWCMKPRQELAKSAQ